MPFLALLNWFKMQPESLFNMAIIYVSAQQKINKVEVFLDKFILRIKRQGYQFIKENFLILKKMVMELTTMKKDRYAMKDNLGKAKEMDGASLMTIKVNGRKMIMMDGASLLLLTFFIKAILSKADIMA